MLEQFAGACCLMLLVVLPCTVVHAQVQRTRPYIPLSTTQEARYMALLPGLRCMQCQNESLASSEAPLAADMRYKVRELIVAGNTDTQVKQYLVDRYGQYVLYKPRFEPLTWLLWIGPFVFLVLAAFAVWRFAKHSSQSASIPSVDEAALKRLLDEDQ